MVISSISWRMLLLLRFNMDIQMHYAPLLLKQKRQEWIWWPPMPNMSKSILLELFVSVLKLIIRNT
ncbi:hypothetical protein Goklo_024758 [Gossypium klotzschianum]|uniref:Uncharacterized protein n=1 Tax=Gossypium klotzschianum TaxID=34286 RepID=A0A7J8WDJ5_9ROSI|nr:hypothetical protein [Gossypium klotzschianum]